jgi:hypothetical protein
MLTTYHHANISLVISIDLNSIVHHQIHELIKSPECANNNTVCIQLDWRKDQVVNKKAIK